MNTENQTQITPEAEDSYERIIADIRKGGWPELIDRIPELEEKADEARKQQEQLGILERFGATIFIRETPTQHADMAAYQRRLDRGRVMGPINGARHG